MTSVLTLSPGDRASVDGPLLAPDAALPSRAALLDPAVVTDVLGALLGNHARLAVHGCELLRVKYRIGESLRVLYRLDLDHGPVLVTGRSFLPGRSAAVYAKALRSALQTRSTADGQPWSALQPVLHDLARETVWWTFPSDRRLCGIADVLRPARVAASLAGALRRWSGSDVVQYAPERSLTLRAHDTAGMTVGFAKCYAPGTVDVAALARRYDLIAARLSATSPVLRSPRALAYSPARNLLVLEPVPGCSWLDLDDANTVAAMRGLGHAIAVVHGTPVAGLGQCALLPFGRLEIGRIMRGAELIGQARPDVAPLAASLAARLGAELPRSADPVLLHGDCHPGNVLVDGATVSLIDLDQSGWGPAAADLGSLLARLRSGAMLGEYDAEMGADMAQAFLAGYAQVRTMPTVDDLRWHTAAALLGERALRAVNRIRPDALPYLSHIVADGHRVLDERD